MAFISGEGSLKPPSSRLALVEMMLVGREPKPAAGNCTEMLDEMRFDIADEAVDDVRCGDILLE